MEKTLSLAPRSIDMLLVCRNHAERRDHEAEILRGLWPHLTDTVVLEFKGPTSGLRKGDLHKLISYGGEYLSLDDCVIEKATELSLVLLVPKDTPTLRREYERCEVEPVPLGDGYVRLVGWRYNIFVVLLDQVAEAEDDDYIRVLINDLASVKDKEVLWWANSWIRKAAEMPELKQLEGYDDMAASLIEALGAEEVASYLTPEQRLAGLDPEQRLAGLDPEQRLTGLDPDALVHALRTLPEDVQALIRKKLNGS